MRTDGWVVIIGQRVAEDGLVLSVNEGRVWASWPEGRSAVMLGDHEAVLLAMSYFIRQSEAAERLIAMAQKIRAEASDPRRSAAFG